MEETVEEEFRRKMNERRETGEIRGVLQHKKKIDSIDEVGIEIGKQIDTDKQETGKEYADFPDKWRFCIYEAGKEPVNILSFDLDGNVTEATSDGVDV